MTKKRSLVFLVILALFLTAGQAFAAIHHSYNLTVPRLGYVTTGNQAKSSSCSNIVLHVTAVGANYTLIAKAENASNHQIAGSANVTTGSAVSFPDTANCNAGQQRHIVFNSNYFVNVQVSGSWTPG